MYVCMSVCIHFCCMFLYLRMHVCMYVCIYACVNVFWHVDVKSAYMGHGRKEAGNRKSLYFSNKIDIWEVGCVIRAYMGHGRTYEDIRSPAECAIVLKTMSYRYQIFGFFISTLPSPQGAGRIQPLRAFRRAGADGKTEECMRE